MNRYLQSNDQVSICHKQSCVHAKGKNANLIAKGATIMLLLIGFAALVRAASN